MMFALFLVFLILSLIFKRSGFFYALFFLFLWICFGWSGENADTGIYEFRYEYYEDMASVTEPFFTWLVEFSNFLKLDYRGFLIMISFFCLLLPTFLLRKLKVEYMAIPLAFYLVYPYMMSVVIVRFTIAATVVIYSFGFLLKKTSYGQLKYLIGVLSATMIHSSCMFFLLLLIVPKVSVKKSVWISLLAFFGILLITTILNYVVNADIFFLSEKMGGVSQEVENMNKTSFNYYAGTILRTIIAVGSFFIVYKKFYFPNRFNKEEVEIMENALKINILFLSSIGFYFISVDFSRLLFPLLFMNYCIYAKVMERSNVQVILGSFIFLICAVELYMLVLRYDFMIKNVFDPFFNSNLIFSGL